MAKTRQTRALAVNALDVYLWKISVGGGYGDFKYVGTEAEAEERRADKARWEAAVARKQKLNVITNETNPNYRDRYVAEGPFTP